MPIMNMYRRCQMIAMARMAAMYQAGAHPMAMKATLEASQAQVFRCARTAIAQWDALAARPLQSCLHRLYLHCRLLLAVMGVDSQRTV